MLTILKDQPTEDKPVLVDDYPYGFRLRTSIRYWVETTKNGQRYVSQTLNPKTGIWNKPKKSTYYNIILVGLDEQEHVTYTALYMYSLEEAKAFKDKYQEYFNEYQKTEIVNIIKMLEVYDKVEYVVVTRKYRHLGTGEITEAINLMELNNYEEVTVDSNGTVTPVDSEKKDQERKENNRQVNKAAIINAAKETSVQKALDTFNRSG